MDFFWSKNKNNNNKKVYKFDTWNHEIIEVASKR